MKKGKKEFVLDCCNQITSRLMPYNCRKDANLESYFASKEREKKKKSVKMIKKSDTRLKHIEVRKSPVSSAPKLRNSSSERLPPIRGQKGEIKPLSRDELRALISKFRVDLKC
jgi:hypothetical protein